MDDYLTALIVGLSLIQFKNSSDLLKKFILIVHFLGGGKEGNRVGHKTTDGRITWAGSRGFGGWGLGVGGVENPRNIKPRTDNIVDRLGFR